MNRRDFVRSGSAAVAAAGLPPLSPAAGASTGAADAPAVLGRRRAADVVVVGAGAFGAWTALHLQEAGLATTLVDAWGPGNPRSTSGGHTRGLRYAYGEREVYTRWAVEARSRWLARGEEWGVELLIPTGRVALAPGMTPSLSATRAVLDRHGVEQEFFGPDELVHRWPQFSPEGVGVVHYEPGAATIRAAEACALVADAFERAGGTRMVARALPPGEGSGRVGSLRLADGESLPAGAVVFACGPWLPRLFPRLLWDLVQTPRRDVFFFGPPPGDTRFGHPALPNFSEGSANVYGFPDIDLQGVKVAPTGGNVRFDPDADERIVVGYQLKRVREWVAMRFPDLAGQPVISSRVCQLEDTPDQHFVIDRLPGRENVWIAGGGTGHAFKHGPVLGDYVARRVSARPTDPELDRLFAVDRPRS